MSSDRWPPARPWPARRWPSRAWPAETEGYAPRTKTYRSPLQFRPLRRFGDARRETPERWVA